MAEGVRKAYQDFQEQLVCLNTLANSIGEEYSKKTSIPQGDPFPMIMVVLLARPWIQEMKSYVVNPRLLADVLQLISTGTNHLTNFEHAFDKTHTHLEAMGAKIAPAKPLASSTDKTASNLPRQHTWRRRGTTILVINNGRDVRAHLCTSSKRKS